MMSHAGSPRSGWRCSAATAFATALLLVVAALMPTASSAAAPAGRTCAAKLAPALRHVSGGAVDVIVVGRRGASRGVAAAVHAAHGRVVAALDLVNGARASVPATGLRTVACAGAVLAVTPNSQVRFQSHAGSEAPTASDFVADSAALPLWRRGYRGTGVGVAVIDTGISSMDDFAGRVVYGPDLSGEGTTVDSYGHGTVMAGIIGGDGTDSANAANGPYTGIAPDATLISVKVAGRNGATDVSTVLQAMHWVSAYKDQFNIRVLNLSWGTPSTQSPTVDPLDYAVERLWQQGIVVVVAAGNRGPGPGTVLKPADDPLVISVGAYEPDQGDYAVAPWSSSGPTAAGDAKPDLVAPGRTLIAQRSYGSQVEADNPSALVPQSYIKGSGTSEATAVTSGAVALLLQARPDLTPDQVKHVLAQTAHPIARTSALRQGAGRLSLAGALAIPAGPAESQDPVATGLGSIEASRGGVHVQTDCGEDGKTDVISGEIDVHCEAWDPATWTGSSWTGSSWTGSSWTGSSWTGSSWTGSSWTGSSWTGSSWTGGLWTGSSWTGSSWTGSSWTTGEWNGSSWTGSSWTGSSWTGSSWTGSSWTGSSWTGDEWNSETSDASGFQTAWWGDAPAAGLHVLGEPSG